MIEKDYLPTNEAELSQWLTNFADILPESGKMFGITPAEISSLNALIYSVIDDLRSGKAESKKIKKEGMIVSLTTMVSRIQKHPSYNADVHGKKLGIN